MPDTTSRVFVVACATCCHPLATTARITEPEIAVLETHLRACRPSEPLPDAPVMLGEVMRRVRVTTAGQA